MQTKNNNLDNHDMTSKRTNKRKKAYRSPRLVVYGGFRRLTKGSTGLARDGGGGATKSKASGGT
jgi:hypothetical protein